MPETVLGTVHIIMSTNKYNHCPHGTYSPLQGIFPTQGSNPGLQHCRQTFYCLSHQGSPIV